MPTFHQQHSQNIYLIEGVDTFIVDSKKLDDGRIQASGEYRMSTEMVEGMEITRLIPEYDDHHQDNNLLIRNNAGQILLDSTNIKRKCFKKVLNICSPAGFFLGKLRKKYFKCRTEYEILAPNQHVLFLLEIYNKASAFSIKVNLVNGDQMIAKVFSSALDDEKVRFTLDYFEDISILQKSLIICAVLFCCEQEYVAMEFKQDMCFKIENTLCCPLYKKDKYSFCIIFIVFPLIIMGYVLLLLNALTLIVCTFGLILFCFKDGELNEVLTMPCTICGVHLKLIRCSCYMCKY